MDKKTYELNIDFLKKRSNANNYILFEYGLKGLVHHEFCHILPSITRNIHDKMHSANNNFPI